MAERNELRQAAAALKGNWTKDTFGEMDGPKCALGHLRATHGMHPTQMVIHSWVDGEAVQTRLRRQVLLLNQAAQDKFPDLVRENGGDEHSLELVDGAATIVFLNDHQDSTEADILSVFELAAERWDVERG